EAPGERLPVAAEGVDSAPLLQDDAAPGHLLMIEPAAPDGPVALLAFARVAQEGAEELPPALITEVDVGQRDAAADADRLLEEDLGGGEARDQEALEDVPRLEAALGDVAPALGVRDVGRPLHLRDAAARVHSLERIVRGGRLHRGGGLRLGR